MYALYIMFIHVLIICIVGTLRFGNLFVGRPSCFRFSNANLAPVICIFSAQVSGFQGRIEKDPDSCYSFWVGGSLQLLGASDILERQSCARFLLSCESKMGGFQKSPGMDFNYKRFLNEFNTDMTKHGAVRLMTHVFFINGCVKMFHASFKFRSTMLSLGTLILM